MDKATAGYPSGRIIDNVQLREGHKIARRLGDMIPDALDKVVPPLFSRYSGGQAYGGRIDGAVRPV